jgi:hypothetical protein
MPGRKQQHQNNMNAFKRRLLSGTASIREARANQIVGQVEARMEGWRLDLKAKIQDLEAQKASILDLGPDQSTSLRVASEDFSAAQLVLKLKGINIELHKLHEEVKVYEQTLADLSAEAEPASELVQPLTEIAD